MWYAWLGKLFSEIGAKFAAVGLAVVGFVLLIFGHRRAVDRAEKQGERHGVESERRRIEYATMRDSATIRDQANATRKEHNDLDGDDLRQRMRDAATDSSNK